jgi:hypothetical protein
MVNYHKYTTSLLGELASYQIIPMYLDQSDASTTYHAGPELGDLLGGAKINLPPLPNRK